MPSDPRKNRKRKRNVAQNSDTTTGSSKSAQLDKDLDVSSGDENESAAKKRPVARTMKKTMEYIPVKAPKISKSQVLRKELSALKVAQLRERLTRRDMRRTGKKAELVERLATAMEEEQERKELEENARKILEAEEAEEEKVKQEAAPRSSSADHVSKSSAPATTTKSSSLFAQDALRKLLAPAIPTSASSSVKASIPSLSTSSGTRSTSPTSSTVHHTYDDTEALVEPTSDVDDAENWDRSFWDALVRCAGTRPMSSAHVMYERVCKKYPAFPPYWRAYAEHCLRDREWDRCASVFQRSLPLCRDVDLYVVYINFVKQKLAAEGGDADRNDDVEKAYEFALNQVGQHVKSYVLWQSFLAYLGHSGHSRDASNAHSDNFSRMSRVNKMREWYHRAVGTAMKGIDAMWNEFNSFERENSNDAEHAVKPHFENFTTARGVLAQREKRMTGIVSSAPPELPEVKSVRQEQQLRLWRNVIEYEKLNPLHRKPLEHREDMRMIYYQCLASLRYFPEIWHDFACYERSVSSDDEEGLAAAAAIYRQAHEAIPDSVVLGLVLAETEELLGSGDPNAVFERLWVTSPCPLVFIEHQRTARRTAGIKAARAIFRRARNHSACDWHVFASAAMQEFNCNREAAVARNIFELGLKRYSESVPYVQAYASLLRALNDENNLRSLYQRCLPVLMKADRDAAMTVWEEYLRFESQQVRGGGSLSNVANVLKQWQESYPTCEAFRSLRSTTLRCRLFGALPTVTSKADVFLADTAPKFPHLSPSPLSSSSSVSSRRQGRWGDKEEK